MRHIRYFLIIFFIFALACKNKSKSNDKQLEAIKLKNQILDFKHKTDVVEMQNGLTIKYKVLTKEEYDILSKSVIGKAILKPYSIEAHEIENNYVIATNKENFNLYLNMRDLDIVIEDFGEVGSTGIETLMNKNKYGNEFPERTKSLIFELISVLNLKSEDVDEKLLRDIDEEINKLKDPNAFRKSYFINLIAVEGEALIKKNLLQWQMELGTDNKTWNPYLKSRKGKINFFIYLYEDIFEKNANKENLLLDLFKTMNEIIKR